MPESCAHTVESGVRKLDGVQGVIVNFTTETIRIDGEVDPDLVAGRVRALGYDLAPEATERVFGSAEASEEPAGNFLAFLEPPEARALRTAVGASLELRNSPRSLLRRGLRFAHRRFSAALSRTS